LNPATAVASYTWTVEAVGVAAKTNTGTTGVKTGEITPFGNTQRLAIDRDPTRETFGRMYVIDANASKKGVWIFNSDLSFVKSTPYGGGITWDGSQTASPVGAEIAPDGKVYISDWADAHAGVWILDNNNPSANFVPVFSTTGDGTSSIHGSIIQTRIVGNTLYWVDEDMGKFAYITDFASSLPWATTPSGYISTASWGAISFLPTATLNFVSDGQGGWWYLQSRGTESATEPAIFHINASDAIDFNSFSAGLSIGNTGTRSAALTINKDRTLLAIGAAANIRVYSISGVPSSPTLTLKYTFTHTVGTTVIGGLEFDAAENLYATGYSATPGSATKLGVYALPKAIATDNKFTTTAPASQPVSVPQAIVLPPQKTFTVTVPAGTEQVYIAGSFSDKSWDITTPHQLDPTANPNEFSGTFPCVDGVEYIYYCEKGDADYKEGVAGAPGQPADPLSTNRTITTGASTTDVVSCWYNVKELKFEVTFDAGVTVTNQLSVRVWPNGGSTSADIALTKSGNKYTGSYGGGVSDKFGTNTRYAYFVPTSVAALEDHADRLTTVPGASDVITGFSSAGISGTYYVPKSGAQQGWASLSEAFNDINIRGIEGDVTLLITSDITETQNVGLINASSHSITIRPDADASRTITFNLTGTDNDGPWGSFCIGIVKGTDPSRPFPWTAVAPAKNIIIDGYAQGGNTRRLKITTANTHKAGNGPVLIVGDCSNITIKNAIIHHVGAATGSGTYGISIRGDAAYAGGKMPSDILVENNEIINTVSGASAQGIGIVSGGTPSPATGVVIRDNIITARTRGMFVSSVNGLDVIGNEFHISQTSGGLLSYAIYAYLQNSGTWNVKENRFIEFKTANTNTGNYGIKAVYSDGTSNNSVVWNIENNYFAGFAKTSTTGVSNLQGIHIYTSATANIRHNTFYLNNPGYVPATAAPTGPTDAAYCAVNVGSGTTTIENNLFVSDYAGGLNYFIRGNATANNNVFAIASGNTNANISSGMITGTNVTIEEVFFANAAAGNLDLTGTSDGDGNLAVPFLSRIPKDIHAVDRNTPLTYAGAFEGDLFDTNMEKKTFTVVAPEGTEHVYIAGTFTTKTWNLVKPYELTPTGNPNEFSGRFPCVDGVEYLYFCEKGDWDYVEGVMSGSDVVARANRVIASGDETSDEIPYWFRLNKITFEVSFDEGITVPALLSAHIIDHQNTSFDFELIKQGNIFTGVLGGFSGAKYGVTSSYKYFIPSSTPVWEEYEDRYITAPKLVDLITGYSAGTISGDYYIPNTGEQRGWSTLQEAFQDINTIGISGDVALLITDDIVSPVNVGLTNNTNHSITIRPDADEDRTITFNQTEFDNAGPWGSLCLGIGNGLRWKDVAPARNITIDGYAEGGSTRRLKITTAETHWAGNFPILILDESTDITVKNCIIEHIGKSTGSSTYGIYLRTNPTPMAVGNTSSGRMPQNVTIENNEITNTTGASSQGIGVYADVMPTLAASGIVVKDNIIRARTRGIFVNDIKGMVITGNEFHIKQTSGGLLSSAIFANTRVSGTFHVTQNSFVELETANTSAGDYGIKAIITGGENSVWYIDNNYFTGFDKTSTSNTSMLQAIRLGALGASYIRHNTFYLNALTNKPANPGTGPSDPTYSAINIAAGTPVIQNNLFVSNEDASPNYFIRGNAPDAGSNNVFCLQAGTTKAKIATGTVPTGLKTVPRVVFKDATAGVLDLDGASINDWDLGVTPLEEIPVDIYGTLRSLTLVYAGAFEGAAFVELPHVGIDTVNAGDIRIVQEGSLTIAISSDAPIQAVRLYDLQGRTIAFKQSLSENTCSITVPGKGVYIVEALVSGGRKVQKTVIR
jgi:hypothetical protein